MQSSLSRIPTENKKCGSCGKGHPVAPALPPHCKGNGAAAPAAPVAPAPQCTLVWSSVLFSLHVVSIIPFFRTVPKASWKSRYVVTVLTPYNKSLAITSTWTELYTVHGSLSNYRKRWKRGINWWKSMKFGTSLTTPTVSLRTTSTPSWKLSKRPVDFHQIATPMRRRPNTSLIMLSKRVFSWIRIR